MSRMRDLVTRARAPFWFVRTRWGGPKSRAALAAMQRRSIKRFNARFGVDWAALPVVTKADVLADFAQYNRFGITLEEALGVAERAERTRDFRERVHGLTVGMSSGTSGRRGVFLLSDAERMAWVGVILGSVLRSATLRRVLTPWRPPLRIGFLLRSDSNLYQAVASGRVAFEFHDLLQPFQHTIDRLNATQPDLVVAPASVLRALAEAQLDGLLHLAPMQIISVAEVLEPDDQERINDAFGVWPDQVYQATEGLLGVSCRLGRLHLNERHVVIEQDWLDAERTRFAPIITDFSRTSQYVWRYRLDDVLRPATTPCGCGNPAIVIEAVEGRADAVLTLDGAKVFPDVVRRAMALASDSFAEWAITAHPHELTIALRNPDPLAEARVREHLSELWRTIDVSPPALSFVPWVERPAGAKRIRIRKSL